MHEDLREAGVVDVLERLEHGCEVELAAAGHLLEFLVLRHGLHATHAKLPGAEHLDLVSEGADEIGEQGGILREMIGSKLDAERQVPADFDEPLEGVRRFDETIAM